MFKWVLNHVIHVLSVHLNKNNNNNRLVFFFPHPTRLPSNNPYTTIHPYAFNNAMSYFFFNLFSMCVDTLDFNVIKPSCPIDLFIHFVWSGIVCKMSTCIDFPMKKKKFSQTKRAHCCAALYCYSAPTIAYQVTIDLQSEFDFGIVCFRFDRLMCSTSFDVELSFI